MSSEFEKYAVKHCGISSLRLHDFRSVISDYVSPTIIEERQLNVATMDVFSRLMMDRIIFLGAPIYDDAANIIQAQLLFLESADPEKDIQLYINSPGGSVSAGLGIYDTMQLVNCDVATICTGLAASMGAGTGVGHRDHGPRNPAHEARTVRNSRLARRRADQEDRKGRRPRLLDDGRRSQELRPDRRSAEKTQVTRRAPKTARTRHIPIRNDNE